MQAITRLSFLLILLLPLLLAGCSSGSSSLVSVERVATPTPDLNSEKPVVPTAPSTLPELIASLSSGDAAARIVAAEALTTMGPKAEPATLALIDNLSYSASGVRESAAQALGAIGPAARSAVPRLSTLLLTDLVNVRRAAAIALGRIGDISAVPALANGLNDKSIGVSIEMAKSIAILTNREFPELNSTSYSVDENGVPLLVKAAQEWWTNEGKYQNWEIP